MYPSLFLNDPLDRLDPFGENAYVVINGKTLVAHTADDFLKIVSNAQPNSITSITIVGHGDYSHVDFNYDNPKKAGGDNGGSVTMVTDKNGKTHVYIEDPNNQTASPIDLIKPKLASGASVYLDGCHTAHGDDNVTTNTAKALSDQKVSGNYYTTGVVPGVDVTFPLSVYDWLNGDKGPKK